VFPESCKAPPVENGGIIIMTTSAKMAPAMLLVPEYTGTLAAARCLAARGVPVHVATSSILAPALWTRAVTKRLRGPTLLCPSRILDWLLERSISESGAVLYPTCDELAWLLARHREDLEPHYRMYSPDMRAVRSILDKRALYSAAVEVGIDVPQTWYPETETELDQILCHVPACLVKPRTQTFYKVHAKGELARCPSDLKRVWRAYRSAKFAPEVVADIQDASLPMVQEYIPIKGAGVFSVSGFVNRSGQLLITRGSRKLLQDPPSAGVGVCFDAVEPPAHLVDRITKLCRKLGYFGVFEVEFLQAGERHLLIDFNPRYFGQMAFDIARGMELPYLVHLCAIGDEEGARIEAAQAAAREASMVRYYRHQVALEWRLATGSIFGAVSAEERRRWREWLKQGSASSVDAFLMQGDPVPAVVVAAATVWRAMRHPRGFWKSLQKPLVAV
jgi:D-aspartate ligase